MSFIYCHQDRRGARWYYREDPTFRAREAGSSSGFVQDRARAYQFSTREEAWAHCRQRRRGGHFMRGKWIVIKVASHVQGSDA